MKLFIDTANLEEIKEALSWGCISGATTNPKIMSNEKPGYSFREKIKEIAELIQLVWKGATIFLARLR